MQQLNPCKSRSIAVCAQPLVSDGKTTLQNRETPTGRMKEP
jgi:hypothetical protein